VDNFSDNERLKGTAWGRCVMMRAGLTVLLLAFLLSTPVFSQGLPPGEPEAVGMSSDRLRRLDSVMQSFVDEGRLPGVLTMIARHGRVVHFETCGMRDIEAGKPMEKDTIFRIYSMTKPITSVAVMMLCEEGRFQLDDPVSKYIPELEGLRVYVSGTTENMETAECRQLMTIRHLLAHTSGLTYPFFGEKPVELLYQESNVMDPQSTLSDMIDKLSRIPLRHHPGEAWNYGVSHDVLGYFVEVVSGMPFDRFLSERIFGPLAMKDTGFYVPKDNLDRLAALYGPAENGGIEKKEDPFFGSSYATAPRLLAGGGGLVSTATDYMRFAQMLLNGGELEGVRLLSPKTVGLMMINHVAEHLVPFPKGFPGVDGIDLVGQGFGFGVSVVMDVAGTGIPGSEGLAYWGGAANTAFWIDPREDLIFMVWTQYRPLLYAELEKRSQVLAYQALVE
jgi:CubicO group peptidase (beta-lactamase class C family)